MDMLSIVGVVLALGAILGGNFIEGGRLASLANLPAFLIVIGGTLGAAALQTPLIILRRSLVVLSWVFFPPNTSLGAALDEVLLWSNIARRDGLLGLEPVADQQTDRFLRTGLQLLVDGSEPAAIRDVLETDIYARQDADMAAAGVFEAMGGYAPTIGILGAVMGLIHVMSHLADPSKLGAGIATAFVATIYGVGTANLIFLPVAAKIKSQVLRQAHRKEMLMEGLIAIADGENPRNIELRLQSFVSSEISL
ncbi:MAG: flagellar motor protein [Pseudomonadales bacterium]|nr:flagellar motor protein [Pseudomonadales bacterium]